MYTRNSLKEPVLNLKTIRIFWKFQKTKLGCSNLDKHVKCLGNELWLKIMPDIIRKVGGPFQPIPDFNPYMLGQIVDDSPNPSKRCFDNNKNIMNGLTNAVVRLSAS